MKGYEAIERAKKSGAVSNIADDELNDALARLERQIGCRAEVPFREYDSEQELYGCGGGVSSGYDDMYITYLKREASFIREDWDCYSNYDTVFNMRFTELCKEIIRNRKPKRYEFKFGVRNEECGIRNADDIYVCVNGKGLTVKQGEEENLPDAYKEVLEQPASQSEG